MNGMYFDGNEDHPLWKEAEKRLEIRLRDNFRSGTYDVGDEEGLDGCSFSLEIRNRDFFESPVMLLNEEWELSCEDQRDVEEEYRAEHSDQESAVDKFFEQTILGPLRLVFNEHILRL